MHPLLIEYARPWKLLTFLAGVALMVAGALAGLAPDWDVPISLIMPVLTYLTAPWSLRAPSSKMKFTELIWRCSVSV